MHHMPKIIILSPMQEGHKSSQLCCIPSDKSAYDMVLCFSDMEKWASDTYCDDFEQSKHNNNVWNYFFLVGFVASLTEFQYVKACA